jgi:SAM-dependent methyltransferase
LNTAPNPDYWDQVAQGWQRDQRDLLWRRHSDQVNISFLGPRLPAKRVDRLLKTDLFDEANSEGLAPLLAQHARTVVGIDVSTSVLRAARRQYPLLRSTAADVRFLPFADESFDCIVSTSTLDHFVNPNDLLASLNELARVLRPGGLLILTLDNPSNPAVGLRNALPFSWLHRIGMVPYYVGATFRARDLCAHAEAIGLKVKESTFILHCPRLLAVMAARLMKHCRRETQDRLLRMLGRFEALAKLPTRRFTGYFVALCATKPTRDAPGGPALSLI